MNKLEFSKLNKKEDMILAFNQLKDDYRQLFAINDDLQSKIDKAKRILNANTHVENIYHALCNLFDKEYQYEIDNEELNEILKGDK